MKTKSKQIKPDEQALAASPALKEIVVASFPSRFYGRVPKVIMMKCDVRSEVPGERLTARDGLSYLAWTNKYGAVSAIFPNGQILGVKPAEFDVVEFFPVKEEDPS